MRFTIKRIEKLKTSKLWEMHDSEKEKRFKIMHKRPYSKQRNEQEQGNESHIREQLKKHERRKKWTRKWTTHEHTHTSRRQTGKVSLVGFTC